MNLKLLREVSIKLRVYFTVITIFLGIANITSAHILKYLLNDLIISQNSIRTVVYGITAFFCYYFLNNIAWRVYLLAKCRIDLTMKGSILKNAFSQVIRNSFGFFQSNSTSVISNNIRSFIDDISYFTNSIGQAIIILSTIVFSIISLFTVNALFGIVLLVWVPCFYFMSWKTAKKIRKQASDVTRELSGIVAHISNVLENNFYVHTNFSYESESAKTISLFPKFAEKYQLKEVTIIKSGFFQGLAVTVLIICMLLLLFKLKQAGMITIGDFALIVGLSSQVAEHTWHFVETIYSLNDFMGTFKEYRFSLKDTNQIYFHETKKFVNGDIEFHNVRYSKEDTIILNSLSQIIKEASRVAIIGPSGIGKTTLSLLLLKLVSPDDGYITINGIDIANLTKDSLYRNISAMCQQNILYNRSVLDNIRYGNDAPFSEIEKIMKAMRLDTRIANMPCKYDTLVNKEMLSGGEKQRILIARTILKEASIYVFDECTSQLDVETEQKVVELILKKCSSKTVIFITHKHSILKYMDKVITFGPPIS